MRVAGIMSGTSLDGVDVAIIDIDAATGGQPDWRIVSFYTRALKPSERTAIHDAIVHGNAQSLCRLHADLGEWFAQAVLDACTDAGVSVDSLDLIGSHGQTIWHDPPGAQRRGATLQLGCPATIAERTAVPVVSDFRTRDVAAGGQGAPLVPWVDRFLFALPDRARVLLNIGGMANLTWVPPRASAQPLLAFDTGPGNALMNVAVDIATNGAEQFDVDGARAARGAVDERVLQELLRHPFFQQAPPKSTGREMFGRPFIDELLQRHAHLRTDADVLLATLTMLTARTIANAIAQWVMPHGVQQLVVTGGGARNPTLMRWLRALLPQLDVQSGDVLGVDPDAKEAVAFAVLAWAHVTGRTGNEPEATGAQGARILGSYTPGSINHE
ncbi:MAG TPA: anhydro-N-acetylmuramic acid kinase [Longimicrobiales bacterium]